MRHISKLVLALLLLSLLASASWLSCGGNVGEGVTITIGEITDLTGPASPATVTLHWAMVDLVRYYNEENLIPGVRLKLATYNNNLDPARDIPAYNWCREQGAEVILGVIASTAEILKPFAENQKTPVITVSVTAPLLDPPGWVFCIAAPFADQYSTFLKWISENHWDYGAKRRVPKVGIVGWREASGIDKEHSIKNYCQAHPDKFKYVGSVMAPAGTMSYGGEIEVLKECDYICIADTIVGIPNRDFLARGYHPTVIIDSAGPAFKGFAVDVAGWEAMDGTLCIETQRCWWDPSPVVELARQILHRYHPDKEQEWIDAGSSYGGGFITQSIFLEMIRHAVEQVGAENFNGQAFYDASLDFELQYEGHPRWYFTETERTCIHDVAIIEFSAEAKDMIRVSDWMPLVKE